MIFLLILYVDDRYYENMLLNYVMLYPNIIDVNITKILTTIAYYQFPHAISPKPTVVTIMVPQ
jgi:hypothetical protein